MKDLIFRRASTLYIIISLFSGVSVIYSQTYKLSITINGSGSVTKNPDESEYTSGTTVELTAIPSSGWQFDQWNGDLSGTDNPKLILMDSDKNVTANFLKINTLEVSIVGLGTVRKNPDLDGYVQGTTVELSALPAGRWQFNHWEGNLSGIENPKSILMDDDKNVTAYFTIDPFTRVSLFSDAALFKGFEATGSVVSDNSHSVGVNLCDYNGDNFPDLFISNSGDDNFLYINNWGNTYTKIVTGDIANDGGDSWNSSWGDYDNDGDPDLFVANGDNQNNFFYTNNGDGSFTKVTVGSIVTDGGNSHGSSWGDYDNDGYLDLFVANLDENNFLYHNNGDGTFIKITEGNIVNDGGASSGCSWSDYDNDGYIDLFVSNNGDNFLYHNNGDGSFTRITEGDVVADGANSFGGSWGDYDNDGDPDLFVASGEYSQGNLLYQNNGDGTFTRITDGDIVNDRGKSMSSIWGDYDNDGDLDLFVANTGQDNFVYSNNGDGTFNRFVASIIAIDAGDSFGSSWGDYNRDGHPDLFVTDWNGDNRLYKNNGNANHWINLRCLGKRSNVSAIGAKVRIKATLDGEPIWQMREISGQTGRSNQNSLNVEFGLKDAAVIDSIRIEWPSGRVQVLTEVVVDEFLTITEDISNRPPLVASALSDTTLMMGGDAFVRDLNEAPAVFTDPDGDTLSYSAISSAEGVATATIAGSILTVSSVYTGKTTITAEADDGNGGSQKTTFAVTVNPKSNQVPVLANAVPDTFLTLGGNNFVRDLNAAPAVFTDPDGDTLSYSASSSADGVATATISGSILIVSPVGTGKTTITVTADDGHSGLVMTTFDVTVNPKSNQVPVLTNAISDTSLSVGGENFVIDLEATPAVFTDPDEDTLSYSAISSAEGVATATIAGSILTVSSVDTGKTTITVEADDGHGGSQTTTFDVTVTPKSNQVPILANAVPDTFLTLGGDNFVRDLEAAPVVFTDPDGDTLSYSASSSAEGVATATMAGSILTVAPVNAGNAQITVEATDGRGGAKTATFSVTVIAEANLPPAITHSPSSIVPADHAILIEANITDDTGIVDATLNYRRGGDTNFTPMLMSNTDGLHQGDIPDSMVTSRGVEYYIVARDLAGLTSTTSIHSIRVNVPEPGVTGSSWQPGGSAQTAYRLISIPLDLDSKSPGSVFEDDLGEYDDTQWRLFEYRSDRQYYEFENISSISSGEAFWLIVKDAGKVIDTGSGKSNSTSGPYKISMHEEWNFIGNPFNFSISLNKVTLENGQPLDIRSYAGQWNTHTDSLEPFDGFAVYTETSTNLLIDPDLSMGSSKQIASTVDEELTWSVRILARCQEARDIDNVAGVHSEAIQGWDALDRPEPPVIGEYISLYFPHDDWDKISTRYCIDARKVSFEGDIWEFEVETNIRDLVNLTFEGIEEVPQEYEVCVVDDMARMSINLRETQTYSFAGSGPENPRLLKLLIGRQGFVEEKLSEIRLLPDSYELSQNFPNPFNPTTTIRFVLPAADVVSLKVYNLYGEIVATLLDREAKAVGFHSVIWNGRDGLGRRVSSGIYLYKVQAGRFSLTKKMILTK